MFLNQFLFQDECSKTDYLFIITTNTYVIIHLENNGFCISNFNFIFIFFSTPQKSYLLIRPHCLFRFYPTFRRVIDMKMKILNLLVFLITGAVLGLEFAVEFLPDYWAADILFLVVKIVFFGSFLVLFFPSKPTED